MPMSDQLERIGLALGGLGAGIQGQLPQFQNQLMNRELLQREEEEARAQAEQQARAEREKTYLLDANLGLQFLEQGRYRDIVRLYMERLAMLKAYPEANPEDSRRIYLLAAAAMNGEEGAQENLRNELQYIVDYGRNLGIPELQQPEEEAYTLNPGDRRYRGNEMVAENPASQRIQEGPDGIPRYVDSGEPVFPGVEGTPERIGAADENSMFRMAVELLGGIFDQAGNIQALDPNLRPKAQAIATEAARLFDSGEVRTRAEAVSKAAQQVGGVDFGNAGGAGTNEPARPQTQAEFDALPQGATYIDPDDGKTYRKR